MRWSQTFIPTMKEIPSDAEVPSHQLMLRAGMIRQLMAGAYTYLPLGVRALKKAEAIVRQEMDATGALEILMPALQPIDLFTRSGDIDLRRAWRGARDPGGLLGSLLYAGRLLLRRLGACQTR